MKKIVKILVIVLFFCTACGNNQPSLQKQENKTLELKDFPVIEEDINNLMTELKNSGQFNDAKFKKFKIDNSNEDGKISYTICYETNASYFDIDYDQNQNFYGINLQKKLITSDDDYFDKQTFYNQILTITYLSRYNINENDFPGELFGDTYQDYISFMAGTSNKTFIYTSYDKGLILNYYPEQFVFSILAINKVS